MLGKRCCWFWGAVYSAGPQPWLLRRRRESSTQWVGHSLDCGGRGSQPGLNTSRKPGARQKVQQSGIGACRGSVHGGGQVFGWRVLLGKADGDEGMWGQEGKEAT